MGETPKVTIITCNYNYGQWIADAIESVVTQTYPNKQMVIIDDQSTDDSIDIVTRLTSIQEVKPDNKLRWGSVNQVPVGLISLSKNGGPSRARNIGIKLTWSNTDIYGILDADDFYKPNKIEKSVTKLMESVNIGAVYSDYDIIAPNGTYRREYKEPFSLERLIRECIVHSCIFTKKEVLNTVGLYREDMVTCEDYQLFARISRKYLIAHIPESLMYVRDHIKNSTNTHSREIWNENWKKVAMTFQRLI
jgi:glycosyltransferase involved in cell wall biosynthesis